MQILPCMVDFAGGVVPKAVSVLMWDHTMMMCDFDCRGLRLWYLEHQTLENHLSSMQWEDVFLKNVCVLVCVCVHVLVCACLYACVCVCEYLCVWVYACVHVFVYLCVPACMHVCMLYHICSCKLMNVHTQVVHVSMYRSIQFVKHMVLYIRYNHDDHLAKAAPVGALAGVTRSVQTKITVRITWLLSVSWPVVFCWSPLDIRWSSSILVGHSR